jgi:glyoxylase-like metal-dependent hydrolase (beta-lactamase superfamily II)
MKGFLLLSAALALAVVPSAAQAPAGAGDHTVEVAPGIYNVTWGNSWGNMGLNVGVSVGEDGLLLVDAQEEAAVPRLIARIARISDKPVRYVVNTHWHFDHVGGNPTFAGQGAVVVAQENTRTRLMTEQPNPLGRAPQRAFPTAFWPAVTFQDRLRLHVNGDDVELLHFPNGHTDGDTIVFFRKADVLFAADLFNNSDYTRVDLRGGSLDGMIAAYDKLLPMLDDKVKVVPGRGPVGTRQDLVEYRQVMVTLRDRIANLIRDGGTLEEAIAAKPTGDFDARWANGPVRPDQLVEEIYADLKRSVR